MTASSRTKPWSSTSIELLGAAIAASLTVTLAEPRRQVSGPQSAVRSLGVSLPPAGSFVTQIQR